MKRLFKQLFCKHVFKTYYKTIGNVFLHESRWYSDDIKINLCHKCGKQKEINQ